MNVTEAKLLFRMYVCMFKIRKYIKIYQIEKVWHTLLYNLRVVIMHYQC